MHAHSQVHERTDGRTDTFAPAVRARENEERASADAVDPENKQGFRDI